MSLLHGDAGIEVFTFYPGPQAWTLAGCVVIELRASSAVEV